jgi:hypothetical protein
MSPRGMLTITNESIAVGAVSTAIYFLFEYFKKIRE